MQKISKEIVKGSFWLYFGSGLTLLISLVTTIVLARLLDKELWGIFASTIAVTSFLSSFYDLGLNYSITHQTAQLKLKRKKLDVINILLRFKFILTLIVALLIYFASDLIAEIFHSPGSGIYFRISAAFFFLFNSFSIFDGIFNGLRWFKLSSITSFLNYLLRLLFAAFFVYLGLGVSGALTGYILALVVVMAVQICFLRKIIITSIISSMPDMLNIRPLLTYGFYMGIAGMAGAITGWTDTIMIGFFMGTTAIGIYKIAFSIATAIGCLVATLNRVIFPVFSAAEASGNRTTVTIESLNKIIKYGSFFVIPAMAGLALSSVGIVNVFFGTQYSDSSIPLLILSYLLFDAFFLGALLMFFAAKGETAFIGVISILAAIANVILNLLLIPFFGLAGAAFASIITRIFAFALVLNECFKRKINLDLSLLAKPIIGTAFMSTILFLLINPVIVPKPLFVLDNFVALIIFVIIGIIIYLVAEILLGFEVLPFYKNVISIILHG